jgi:hypothetical protein
MPTAHLVRVDQILANALKVAEDDQAVFAFPTTHKNSLPSSKAVHGLLDQTHERNAYSDEIGEDDTLVVGGARKLAQCGDTAVPGETRKRRKRDSDDGWAKAKLSCGVSHNHQPATLSRTNDPILQQAVVAPSGGFKSFVTIDTPANLNQHHKKYFIPEEDTAIIKGVQELGDNPGRWADIKRMFPIELAQKSNDQIFGRWRVIKRKLSITSQASAQSSTTAPFATTQSSAPAPALAQIPIQQQSPAPVSWHIPKVPEGTLPWELQNPALAQVPTASPQQQPKT